jgi:hypothetical protein
VRRLGRRATVGVVDGTATERFDPPGRLER